MATNIFKVESRNEVPDISKATNPVLDIPIIDTNSIEAALESYSKQETSDVGKAEENFNQLVEVRDKLTGQRFDNDPQAQVFEKAKKEAGLSDDAFKVSMDDLRDPFKVRGMRSKLGEIYERSDVKQVLFEQERGKLYLERINELKDMNPKLYKKALAKYNDYRGGKVNGFQLLAQEFTPIDVEKTITDALKLVPQIDTSDIETKHGLTYEKIKKQRSRKVIDEIINRLNSNDIFKNNVEANFTNEAGEFDKAGYDAYVDQLATEYAKQHTDIENVRDNKATKATTPTSLDRLVKNVEALGGDTNAVTQNIAELESMLTDKNKHLERVEETSAEVRVYYTDDNKEGEQYISIPKSGQSVAESGPIGYEVPAKEGSKMTISDEDIDSFIQTNPEIEDLDTWGQSHTAPIDGAKSNVGQKTMVKIEDGKLVTNDISFLRQMGIVDDGVDYDELGEHGFEYEKNADGTTVVKIDVGTNKRTVTAAAIDLTDMDIRPEDLKTDIKYDSIPQSQFKSSVKAKNILNLRPPGEKAFKSYASYEDAIQDSVKLMLRYYEGKSGPMRDKKKHLWGTEGQTPTLEEVIRTWSPSKEDCVDYPNGKRRCGDTSEKAVVDYIETVSSSLNVSGDEPITNIGIANLTKAMAMVECPKCVDEIVKEYGSFEGLFKKAFNVKDAPESTEFPEEQAETKPAQAEKPGKTVTSGEIYNSWKGAEKSTQPAESKPQPNGVESDNLFEEDFKESGSTVITNPPSYPATRVATDKRVFINKPSTKLKEVVDKYEKEGRNSENIDISKLNEDELLVFADWNHSGTVVDGDLDDKIVSRIDELGQSNKKVTTLSNEDFYAELPGPVKNLVDDFIKGKKVNTANLSKENLKLYREWRKRNDKDPVKIEG